MTERYSFLSLFARLQSELNRLFREFDELAESSLREGEWSPSIDVVESDDGLLILIEVPGIGAEDLDLEVSGNHLTIKGTKGTTLPDSTGVKFQRMERSQGTFARSIQLPQPVNTSRAGARVEQGLLRVSFPKVEDKRLRVRSLTISDALDSEHD